MVPTKLTKINRKRRPGLAYFFKKNMVSTINWAFGCSKTSFKTLVIGHTIEINVSVWKRTITQTQILTCPCCMLQSPLLLLLRCEMFVRMSVVRKKGLERTRDLSMKSTHTSSRWFRHWKDCSHQLIDSLDVLHLQCDQKKVYKSVTSKKSIKVTQKWFH